MSNRNNPAATADDLVREIAKLRDELERLKAHVAVSTLPPPLRFLATPEADGVRGVGWKVFIINGANGAGIYLGVLNPVPDSGVS